MASAVGSLHVDLGLNSAQFHTGIGKAQSALSGFSRHAGKIGAAIGVALAAIPAALAMGIKGAANAADEMGKAAQKVGIGTEALSGIKHAADLAGVGFNDLQTGLVRLSKAISEALEKPTSDAGRAFASMGISLRDASGNIKSTDVILSEMAGKFAGYQDGANKTALAVQLLGRAGANLIPLLNGGSAGMASAAEEAQKLGLIISRDTSRAAEDFNDNISRLQSFISGGFLQILAQIAPIMATMSSSFIDGAKDSNLFERAGQRLAEMLDGLARFAATTAKELQIVAAVFNYIKEVATTKVGPGFFEREAAAAERGRSSIRAAGEEYGRTIRNLEAKSGPFGGLAQGKFNQVEGMGALRSALSSKPNAPNPFTKAGSEAKAGAAKMTEAEREIASAYQKLKSESESLYESTRTPLEAFRDQMEKLAKMMNPTTNSGQSHALISQETYTRAVEQAQERLNKAIIAGSEVAQTLQSNFNSMFDSFLSGTFNARDAIKKLLSDLAKMMMNKIFTQLLGSVFGSFGGKGGPLQLLGGIGGNANGTNNWRGGLTWVGERGKELVNLPKGSQVIPNRSAEGMGGGSSFAPVYNIDARGAQAGVAEQIGAAMRENNRVLMREMPKLLVSSQRRSI
ncbi:MAG: hypothetical protein Q8M31_18415 [Beijerinckiaceae bacterium]|nr:hypothetical protein [Beijerinckiaceae bacterium]